MSLSAVGCWHYLETLLVVTKVDDREGCLWHLVDIGQGCCEASQKKKGRDRTAPTRKNYLAPNISSAEVKKPSSSLKDPGKVHTHSIYMQLSSLELQA